jgi:hypothetical protein
MSEKPWTPRIVQNETLKDVIAVIKNSIESTVDDLERLSTAVTTLTLGNRTRIRARFYLKDKEGFVMEKSPSTLALAELTKLIEEDINSRSINKNRFTISTLQSRDSEDTSYIDFIINES